MKKSDETNLLIEGSLFENIGNLAALLKARLEVMQMTQVTFVPKLSKQKEDSLPSTIDASHALKILKEETIGDCKRCKLCTKRSNVVFGAGDPQAELVFVGEAPGAEEDKQGLPFVGRAGKLLTKMIEAMGFTREQVYICNVIKCRPPENRDPEIDEVLACEPFLKQQLAIIKPKVIVTLGRHAGLCLLKTTEPMSQLRGSWRTYENIPLMPTFHPAYLLRSPSKKKEAWEDLQKVLQKIKPLPV